MMLIDLDNPHLYGRLDPQGLGQRLRELPQDCRRAWQETRALPLPPDRGQVRRVLLLGMGGSAIAGDLLQGLAGARLPIQVCRELSLPPGVDGDTLVIASSFSGNTEETLAAFSQALEGPARKLALAGGGRLMELARERHIPLFPIHHPGPPRAALGYCLVALVGLLGRWGLLPPQDQEVEEMARLLEEIVAELDVASPTPDNPAKGLARRLFQRTIVVYGAGFLEPLARRWKTQFNENSKAWAFHEAIPELGHNAVVGYQSPPGLAQNISVVLLHSGDLPPRLQARYQGLQELLEWYRIAHEQMEARGGGPLCQMMSLALLGDYTSYYLALLHETNPWPVEAIDRLKKRLAEL